jgi:serine/threonine-protein kinase
MNDATRSATGVLRRANTAGSQGLHAQATLPDDLVGRSARRLRSLALLYAFVFFMSTFFAAAYTGFAAAYTGETVGETNFLEWTVSAVSIAVALVVAGVTTRAGLTTRTLVALGLSFEIVGSFGIAMSQYWGIYQGLEYRLEHLEIAGLSWVAPWVLLFSIVIPVRPRTAVMASLASVSAVPITMALTMKFGGTSIALTAAQFFAGMVLPYLLIAVMAHVGASAIYRLGTDVAEAREMGSYRLVERLGQGGMGEVWRATHRMLARPAAIKLIRPEVLEDEGERRDIALARFTHEARVTASMQSPHTITVYDFGTSAEGAFYYVMELLDGFDLQTLVQKFGPVPAERAVYLMRQVCHSLSEAHQHGLIHRDIKPANITVCRYGRDVDFVEVLDFGLVKLRRDADWDFANPQLTAAHVVTGTPGYMAPEQALGGYEADARTDLYAVGCVAFWLLTGRPVFEGATVVEKLTQHVRDEPLPPSRCSSLPIPPALDAIVLRCLAKRPEGRPQSADELGDALADACDVNTWTEARARDWWELRRVEARA